MINAIRLYRIARWLYLHHIPFLPKLLQLITFLMYNCSVSYKMSIGRGSFFNHAGIGVLINPKVVIGKNCKIGNNVSIVGQGPYKECPKIGNNVIVAPNAVVNKSVHTNMIVGGIPAKIIGDVTKLDYDIFANESWKEGHKPFLT